MKTITIISKEELKGKIDRHEDFELVNVLDPKYYRMGLIKGSKRIPLDDLDDRMQELDKTKDVVVYCASYDCHASRKAAEKLAEHGFRVAAYEGGIKEWKEAGYPTDK
jgi:rhodanese-related sulfurtransferase